MYTEMSFVNLQYIFSFLYMTTVAKPRRVGDETMHIQHVFCEAHVDRHALPESRKILTPRGPNGAKWEYIVLSTHACSCVPIKSERLY
jgi:hypothetical protein